MSRRTGKEALYSRIIQMDVKDREAKLTEKEAETFVCDGGYLRCPKCTCQEPVSHKKESAAELCARLGFDEPSEEQKRQNLDDNLFYFFNQVGSK
jgi:hypothetical protein